MLLLLLRSVCMFRLIFALSENLPTVPLASIGHLVSFLAFIACFVILTAPIGSELILFILSRLDAKRSARSWVSVRAEYRRNNISEAEFIDSRYVGYIERTLVTLCLMFDLAVFLIPIFAAKIQLRQNLHTIDTRYSTYVFIGSMVSAAWAVGIGLLGAKVLHYLDLALNLKEICSSCYLSAA